MKVIERIKEKYDELSKAQKRIADFLVNNIDRACFLSLKELSRQVKTTEVTILKFTRQIGYDSFVELKKELQLYVSTKLSPSEKIATAIKSLGGTDEAFQQIITRDREIIEQTMDYLAFDDVRRALAIMKKATRIYTVGANVSSIVADFITYRLRNLDLDVVNFDVSDIHTMAMQLTRMQPSEVFIIISLTGYARRVVALTEFLRIRDVEIICITDRITSPVGRNSDVAFSCATDSPVFYNSISAAIALSNLLVSLMAIELKDSFKENHDRVEATLNQLNEIYTSLMTEG